MKAYDDALASPFRIDWMVPLDRTTQDDYARAVADKAEVLVRSAKFLSFTHETTATDLEVRVWIEAACGPACVSITWEPGVQAFGFYLLDDALRERLGVVVFDALPCVDADEAETQLDRVLDAALQALGETRGQPLAERAAAIREAEGTVRVPVVDANAFQHGIDP